MAESTVASANLNIILLGDATVCKSTITHLSEISNLKFTHPKPDVNHFSKKHRCKTQLAGKGVLVDFWDSPGTLSSTTDIRCWPFVRFFLWATLVPLEDCLFLVLLHYFELLQIVNIML